MKRRQNHEEELDSLSRRGLVGEKHEAKKKRGGKTHRSVGQVVATGGSSGHDQACLTGN